MYTHINLYEVYTQMHNIPRIIIFFRNGKPNTETEGITGWLQIVAF